MNIYICILVVFVWTDISSTLVCNIALSPEICHNELEHCFTLSQFAANTSQLLDSNNTVTVLEGVHNLDSQLSVEHILTLSMSSSLQNVIITCKTSTMFHLYDIGYVCFYNLKFRGCHFAVQRVNNFSLVNVEITDLKVTFNVALQLLQTNTNIISSMFSRITTNYGAVDGIIRAHQSNVTIDKSIFKANMIHDDIALFNGKSSIIIVTGSTFRNMKLMYGLKSLLSGLFHLNEKCTAVFYNSTFLNNNATYLLSKTSSQGSIITNYGSLNITSCYFISNSGGAIQILEESTVNIKRSVFTNNSAPNGGAVYVRGGEVSISECSFTANIALDHGGAVDIVNGTVNISGSTFQNNHARIGGGILLQCMHKIRSTIIHCDFRNNTAIESGGAIYLSCMRIAHTYLHMHCTIIECSFIYNTVKSKDGGAIYISETALTIRKSYYASNSAVNGGALACARTTAMNISGCVLINNKAHDKGGGLHIYAGTVFVIDSKFKNNVAASGGAVSAYIVSKNFTILKSNFSSNKATFHSGGAVEINPIVLSGNEPLFNINIGKCIFRNNIAAKDGGSIKFDCSDICSVFSVIESHFINNQANLKSGNGGALAVRSSNELTIRESDFQSNKANDGGAIFTVYIWTKYRQAIYLIKSYFKNNSAVNSGGALKVHGEILSKSKRIFGYTKPKKNKLLIVSQSMFSNNTALFGGGIFADPEPNLLFNISLIVSNSIFTENHAMKGGALFTNFSGSHIYGEVLLTKNTATDSGGGVYLNKSKLKCQRGGVFKLLHNTANKNGGGIYFWDSFTMIDFDSRFYNALLQSAAIIFSRNHGEKGGGIYLNQNSVIYIFNYQLLNASAIDFINNSANYGQDIYVLDDCYTISQCFIQLSQHQYISRLNDSFDFSHAIYFSLKKFEILVLKSCFHPCITKQLQSVNESENLKAVSNIQNVNLGSLSLKLTFCQNSLPDLVYHPSPISKNKFSIQIALVDQFSHAVSAIVKGYIADGSILSHQRSQMITNACTTLNFTAFSSSSAQELIISPLEVKNPYQISSNDQINVTLIFQACKSCPIGFEKSFDEIKGCSCVCNTDIKKFLTKCNESSGIITKEHTTAWISYINYHNLSEYLIYHYCPLNYCFPPDYLVDLNLNIPNGADAQCAHNRSGLLCGVCSPGLSLSLGSSHCIPCSSQWPGTSVAIIIGSFLAGVCLVAVILVLNLTVAVGTLNGLIFYANIAAANSSTFFPSTSIFSIIIAWMNLELGIDTCFFEGMNAYWKTWVELAFPVYVISLIIVIIIISEKSMKFANLIGQKNPVATLDTLILLAYVKFLRIIISSYSFTILDYPDHSRPIVWLPDATVSYFSGKHIALLIVATFILLLGIAYTLLLFTWQWLLYHQNMKIFLLD